MWAWPQSVQNDNLCYIKRCGSIAAPSLVSKLARLALLARRLDFPWQVRYYKKILEHIRGYNLDKGKTIHVLRLVLWTRILCLIQ